LSEDAALAPQLPPLSTGKDKDIHLAALGMVVMGKTQSALVGHAFTQNIGAGDRRLSLLALASGQEANAAVSKETVGLNHIPLEEEAGPLRVHPLSLFSHATEEECRELFVSLRDNAKVSPFWYWGNVQTGAGRIGCYRAGLVGHQRAVIPVVRSPGRARTHSADQPL
jgi:hypothetical protein